MYGLKPVPFKDGTLLFMELWSTGFAVISVHQRGMEIAQIRPSSILPIWTLFLFIGGYFVCPASHVPHRMSRIAQWLKPRPSSIVYGPTEAVP